MLQIAYSKVCDVLQIQRSHVSSAEGSQRSVVAMACKYRKRRYFELTQMNRCVLYSDSNISKLNVEFYIEYPDIC